MRIIDLILETLYPKRCIICHEIMDYGTKEHTCHKCKENADYTEDIDCIAEAERNCGDRVYFDECHSVFYYDYAKGAIEHFKFRKYRRDSIALADYMNKYGSEKGIFENIDVVIPVPVHEKRLKERGFNHAGELARKIADKNNILYDENVLIRVKNTKPQYTLSYEERKGNIEGAFEVVDKERICGKRIMLVDDIFTTGATVNECSKMLKRAGAKYVSVFELSCSSALKQEKKTDV